MARKKSKTLGIASGKTRDPEIIRELNDESVIEMLGGVPIYVHSNVENAKIGLKTAERMIGTALQRSENAAKAELKSQLMYLGEKRREIKKQFGSEDNFKKIMQVLSSDNNKDVGSKIKNLLDLKVNATAFSKLQHAWNQKGKGKKEITLGSGKNKTVMRSEDYSNISDWLRTNMAKLINTMTGDDTLNQAVRQYVDKWLSTLTEDKLRVAVSKFNNKEMSKDIGWFLELMFNDMRFPCGTIGDGQEIEIGFKNLSADFRNKDPSTGIPTQAYNKSDTLICFYKFGQDDPFFSFPVSDKTGMDGYLQAVSTDLKELFKSIRMFTANIHESFSLESKAQSRVIGGPLTKNEYGVNFTNAARYILGNTDVFSKTSKSIKSSDIKMLRSEIAAVIMWSAAVVEITGLLKPDNATTETDLPLFIRHFDKLYFTEDILRNLDSINGLDIIKSDFVNKTYLADWLSGHSGETISNFSLLRLWMTKYHYILNVIESHSTGSRQRVTYKGLIEDPNVNEALNTICSTLEKNLTLNISMRIVLNKYKPLF